MNDLKARMVWMDLEMTGLEPDTDEIIEIATLVTDGELNIVARGPELILKQPAFRFEQMDDWNQTHHKKSGLWDKVLSSEISCSDAENQTLEFLREHVTEGKAPLCGNSIWQDRRFIRKYMPKIDKFLHYRMIDVSTVKELTNRWYPNCPNMQKQEAHRAMGDIEESIKELAHYRKLVFKEKIDS